MTRFCYLKRKCHSLVTRVTTTTGQDNFNIKTPFPTWKLKKMRKANEWEIGGYHSKWKWRPANTWNSTDTSITHRKRNLVPPCGSQPLMRTWHGNKLNTCNTEYRHHVSAYKLYTPEVHKNRKVINVYGAWYILRKPIVQYYGF